MNPALETLAAEIGLATPSNERLRLAFGHACAARVETLLEQDAVRTCLDQLGRYLREEIDAAAFDLARQDAGRLAHRHPGSASIDGCGHAAVSASYAVAHALNGRALQAADYAAYATVYASGGYAAVAQREAFELEFAWQVTALAALAADGPGAPAVGRSSSQAGRTAPLPPGISTLAQCGVGHSA